MFNLKKIAIRLMLLIVIINIFHVNKNSFQVNAQDADVDVETEDEIDFGDIEGDEDMPDLNEIMKDPKYAEIIKKIQEENEKYAKQREL
jgi:hypothetical protein